MSKGGSGSGGQQTSTTTNMPPSYLMPGIRSALANLLGITMPGGNLASYNMPNQQVAGFNPNEEAGLAGEVNTAGLQQGVVDQGLGLTNATLAGDYLNPSSNPYLAGTSDAMNAQTISQYRNAIAPTAQGEAALSGAFGGSAQAENQALNQFNLGNTLSNSNELLYGQNYANERQNQLSTLQDLPAINAAAQQPSQAILGAGGVQQQQQQQELNTNYQNQENQAQWPYQLLSYITNELSGLGEGAGRSTTTGPSPYASNPLQSILGLGGLGLGAANLFGSGAGGTSAAAGLGGSLSGLGGWLASLFGGGAAAGGAAGGVAEAAPILLAAA